MNAIDLLKQQHSDIDQLIANVEGAKDLTSKRAAFWLLADNLAAHMSIEEKLFYPAVMATRTDDSLLEAIEEHLAIRRLLADMMGLSISDTRFDARLSVLEENLQHHNHHEEEGALFPTVKQLIAADELEVLGSEMLWMFETLMEGSPPEDVPRETAEAAPLALR